MGLQRCYVNWELKATKYVPIAVNECVHVHGNLVHIHTEVTNTLSTVYTTLDYEYRHKNKGTGLDLLRKRWVYKSDQESYKMSTILE